MSGSFFRAQARPAPGRWRIEQRARQSNVGDRSRATVRCILHGVSRLISTTFRTRPGLQSGCIVRVRLLPRPRRWHRRPGLEPPPRNNSLNRRPRRILRSRPAGPRLRPSGAHTSPTRTPILLPPYRRRLLLRTPHQPPASTVRRTVGTCSFCGLSATSQS